MTFAVDHGNNRWGRRLLGAHDQRDAREALLLEWCRSSEQRLRQQAI
ncbi:hypothetical protein DVA67_007075 [Solirubrobacter sp. CPCC 204708]|uniref:Uncharacterized protein n=1 Tax=Solirubrobacter deserti TaxID=2282478 RepID=A0ABT4RP93_9ACTN|nr:hypothetical protein [Solirubrobacter deserti]MBE2315731.1 hypothetical protein [Solirubrobacter deserti]MDA0140379.1 hypothetical protein [Solirubrobacter deserti]